MVGSSPENEEDRSVEQILDEIAPLRSRKLVSVNRPWTVMLRVVVIVSLLVAFAICWK